MKDLLTTLTFTLSTFILLSQGSCTSEDLNYMNENAAILSELSQDCALGCLGASDQEQCVLDCIMESTPLTEDCSSCFSTQVGCVAANCFSACLFGTAEACEACALENCLEDFNTCAGIVDLDLDGFTTLNDCDDSNGTIYPDAPGTGEGLDNNCDGEITGEELAQECNADLNGNGLVDSADLTVLLGGYGCTGADCQFELDGEPGTGAGDLTAFLTWFGQPCE